MMRRRTMAWLAGLLVAGMLVLAACGPAGETAKGSGSVTDGDSPAPTPQVPTTVDEIPRISAEELKQRLDDGEDIVVGDSRPAGSYAAGHIAGAISLPGSQVASLVDPEPSAEFLEAFPRDGTYVFY